MKLVSSVAAALFAAACLANAAWAGTILHAGSQGTPVTTLQQYLHANQRADMYAGAIDSAFGPLTKYGLAYWQKHAGYRPSGSIAVGSRQWNQLKSEAVVTRLAGYISRSAINAARQYGWAVDASKSPGMVSVLHYTGGTVQVALSISAAYGGYKSDDNTVHNTDDGVFRIFAEHDKYYTAHVPGKPWNGAPMPYATCFNGGDCLHYDGLYPSHGCIHIPSMPAAEYINSLPYGTTVVVHE
jgi:hypothetical protein